MRVKMVTLDAGPGGVKEPGKVYDVDAKEAKALIDGGYAVSAESSKVADPPKAPEVPEGLTAHNGGWYELPNGEKVQGLDKAIQALSDFQAAEQEAAEEAARKQLEEEAARKQQEEK